MKVTLENTPKIVELRIGDATFPARIWQGETENGIRCHAFITRIACDNDDESAKEFARDLERTADARPDIQAIPLRLIL